MSVLIKGYMEVPENCVNCHFRYEYDFELFCTITSAQLFSDDLYGFRRHELCPLIEVPEKFGDLIDKEKLYERTAEWESQALNQVEKLMHRDDEEGKTEWRRWSAILNERTAFKHDVADAPVIIDGNP